MNKRCYISGTLAAIFLFAGTAAFAQKNATTPWKKTVVRMIDLKEKEDDKQHHLKNAGSNFSLSELMVNEAIAGKVTAWTNTNGNFTAKISAKDVKDIFTSKIDTIKMVDPVTGKEITRYISKDVNYDALQKFRLQEDWVFNPSTGKTEIQITGIAPIREIYGDDGEFRGVQATFWLRYNEAVPLIAGYDLNHPNNTLENHIWDDYFLSDVKPAIAK
jgi:hypothetical protein